MNAYAIQQHIAGTLMSEMEKHHAAGTDVPVDMMAGLHGALFEMEKHINRDEFVKRRGPEWAEERLKMEQAIDLNAKDLSQQMGNASLFAEARARVRSVHQI